MLKVSSLQPKKHWAQCPKFPVSGNQRRRHPVLALPSSSKISMLHGTYQHMLMFELVCTSIHSRWLPLLMWAGTTKICYLLPLFWPHCYAFFTSSTELNFQMQQIGVIFTKMRWRKLGPPSRRTHYMSAWHNALRLIWCTKSEMKEYKAHLSWQKGNVFAQDTGCFTWMKPNI